MFAGTGLNVTLYVQCLSYSHRSKDFSSVTVQNEVLPVRSGMASIGGLTHPVISQRASHNIIITSNLSNDRSKASSKTIPPHSAI